jgi:hypothetical protein
MSPAGEISSILLELPLDMTALDNCAWAEVQGRYCPIPAAFSPRSTAEVTAEVTAHVAVQISAPALVWRGRFGKPSRHFQNSKKRSRSDSRGLVGMNAGRDNELLPTVNGISDSLTPDVLDMRLSDNCAHGAQLPWFRPGPALDPPDTHQTHSSGRGAARSLVGRGGIWSTFRRG